jgi:hypothetical protein
VEALEGFGKTTNITFCVLSVFTDVLRTQVVLEKLTAVIIIPLRTLPKLRISLQKKLSLVFLFALGSFAIIAAILRIVFYINSATIFIVIVWSLVETVVSFLVVNGPALRPLLFRGKHFESSNGVPSERLAHPDRSTHDTYELTPNDKGIVCEITSGEPHLANTGRKGSSTIIDSDTPGILRTVEVRRISEDIKENTPYDDKSSAPSSMWAP